jgi:hypothetical protein
MEIAELARSKILDESEGGVEFYCHVIQERRLSLVGKNGAICFLFEENEAYWVVCGLGDLGNYGSMPVGAQRRPCLPAY